jgi:ribosomal protein S18 acetylase RimI-like enzyme
MNIFEKGTQPFTLISIHPMNSEMVNEVSSIHRRTFKDAMNVRLGVGYVKAFFHCFLRIHSKIALVAIDEDTHILGYIVGGPLGCGQSINRDLFWVAGRALCLQPWLLLQQSFRSAVIAGLKVCWGKSQEIPLPIDLPQPIMGLTVFAVESWAQGQGIGKRLLEAFEEGARALQMRSLGLAVYPGNVGARRVYEQCGWRACENLIKRGKVMHYSRIL